jgi:hypothetical protein
MLAALRKWTHREPVLMWTAYWSIAGALVLILAVRRRRATPDRPVVSSLAHTAPLPPPPSLKQKKTGLSAPLFIHAFTSGPAEPKIKNPPSIKEVLQAMAPQAQQPAAAADK